MIRIDTILKYVCQNMMKYPKIEQMAHEMLLTDKVIPWIAASKSSDQKLHVITKIDFYIPYH